MPNVKIRPSFWEHDHCVPLSRDLAPSSIFERNQDYLVFDLETTELIQDSVPFNEMKISVVCAWDSKIQQMLTFFEQDVPKFLNLMQERLVVGYNIRGFDIPVLTGYGLTKESLDVFDIVDEVKRGTGQRYVKLQHVAMGTLGEGKSADGTLAVEWYKQGRLKEIAEYCARDVEVTHKIFRHGLDKKFLVVQKGEEGEKIQFATDWT